MELLNKYSNIIGQDEVRNLVEEAKPLRGKYVTHVNATFYGGGVAEILNSLVLLMNDVGIKAGWRHIKGSNSFFEITKLFHNGAQGGDIKLDSRIKEIYEEVCRRNSIFMHLETNDIIVAHDPQVLPLIEFYRSEQPWLWRCHIDLTQPDKTLWRYLKRFIKQYDEMIVSDESYQKKDVDVPQTVIMPSIDPLSEKNKYLSSSQAKKILSEVGVKFHKPIISQISRYDPWKDPLGVVEAFKKIRKKTDCQLVLLGNTATDDPEGQEVYKKVVHKTKHMKDVTVLLNVDKNDLVVNSLQRMSEVVLQKSIKEGFALTVSEALWKGTPVVAGNVGGIPNQIVEGKNGHLVTSVGECAEKTVSLLNNKKTRRRMGEFAKKYVRDNFLITRHLRDYIRLLNQVNKRYGN